MLVQYKAWLPSLRVNSPAPLYEQILESAALAIATGELEPGDLLPSVRKLAAELRINPNTAARSVRELESAGLSTSRRGLGSVVAAGSLEPASHMARRALLRELDATLQVARSLGLELEELQESLQKRWQETNHAARA